MSQFAKSDVCHSQTAIDKAHFSLAAGARNFRSRIEFGDALLLFYFVVFARPWFWGFENAAAWCFTIPLAIAGWYLYVATKQPEVGRFNLSFWLIVGLPLIFIYALRAPFPDSSFDVWTYHLFHGERGLVGFIYRPGEFFPTPAPYNPAPDMLTAIFRHLLGYRMGTIINFLALLWAATIVDKILRPYVRRPRLRAAFVLLTLFAEHLLFEINNYMPDLLALPLMLEATRLVLDSNEWRANRRVLVRLAFLIGASMTLKLSNGAVAIPIVLICIWRWLSTRPLNVKSLAFDALLSVVVFAALLPPCMWWVFKLTVSSVMTFDKGYFRSPLYPATNGWDGRWGGFGAPEILSWPILIFFKPQRTAELGVYSGRLSIGFIAALMLLALGRRVEARTRKLAFIVVLGSLLWSLTMGYIRYGLYIEALSGLFMIVIASLLLRESARITLRWQSVLAAIICLILMVQAVFAYSYASRQEWSMRPTAFQEFSSFANESKYLFRDRSIGRWLPAREREMFDRVDVWVVSGSKTAGLLPFLNDQAPVLGLRSAGIISMEPSRREFARMLDTYAGKRIYSLAFPEDYEESVKVLRSVGIGAGPVETVVVPFFGPSPLLTLYIFEIQRNPVAQ